MNFYVVYAISYGAIENRLQCFEEDSKKKPVDFVYLTRRNLLEG